MAYTILIVDDNVALGNLYQIVFERVGYEVQRAGGGVEALEMLAAETPHVVLLDTMMPEMDGLEVCRRIRESWPERPPYIVVYTANNRPEMRQLTQDAGADALFSKNMSVFELPARVTSVLSADGGHASALAS